MSAPEVSLPFKEVKEEDVSLKRYQKHPNVCPNTSSEAENSRLGGGTFVVKPLRELVGKEAFSCSTAGASFRGNLCRETPVQAHGEGSVLMFDCQRTLSSLLRLEHVWLSN